MNTIQVAVADTPYARALKQLLTGNGSWDVVCVDAPDLARDVVLVVDAEVFDCLPLPLSNPERVVLILRGPEAYLNRAWQAGVKSVVSEKDPLNTVVLAIMAAGLGAPRPKTGGERKQDSPEASPSSPPD